MIDGTGGGNYGHRLERDLERDCYDEALCDGIEVAHCPSARRMTRSMSSVQGVKGSRLARQADDREFNGEKEPQWIQEVKLGNVQGHRVSLALLGDLEGAVVDVHGHLPEEEDEGDARNGLRAKDDSGEEGKDEEHGVSGCGGECGCVGGCSPASVFRGFLKTSAGCTKTLAA